MNCSISQTYHRHLLPTKLGGRCCENPKIRQDLDGTEIIGTEEDPSKDFERKKLFFFKSNLNI